MTLSHSIHNLLIDIGAVPVRIRTESPEFARMLGERYGKFVTVMRIDEGTSSSWHSQSPTWAERLCGDEFLLDVELIPPVQVGEADELSVRREGHRWVLERGDFRAEWDTQRRQGWVRQSINPYSMDSVLRILHSLSLATQGGFLVHAASAICDGRAVILAGVSGAGKTTLAQLAPPDVVLLTDEISYVKKVRGPESGVRRPNRKARSEKRDARSQESQKSDEGRIASGIPRRPGGKPEIESLDSPIANRQWQILLAPSLAAPVPAFEAFGTPFSGELARIGEKVQAPLAGLFLLKQGHEEPGRTGDQIGSRTGIDASHPFLRPGQPIGKIGVSNGVRFCRPSARAQVSLHAGRAGLEGDSGFRPEEVSARQSRGV